MIKNKKVAQFIGESVIKYRAKLIEFHPTKKFGGTGMKYVGCASGDLLKIATGGNFGTWFEIFVHETCHLDQSQERPRWFSHRQEKVYEFDEWLEKRSESIQWSDVCKIVELEHDCEERALKKIKKYDLPINVKHYSQRANDYLARYIRAFETRKWNGKNGSWKDRPKELIPLEHLIL